ncbi:MAG: DMT family transporter [Thermoanaerobaculia bacterium]
MAEPALPLCPESSTAAPPAPSAAPAWKVHLTLILVQLAFGGFHVVAKAVLSDLAPLALAAIRVGMATPILMALAWRRDRFVPARSDWPVLALLGGLGVFANQALFITGLRYTTAINASILMPSLPVFTVAIAAVMGVERITRARMIGIVLSVAGAMALVNPMRFSADRAGAIGNVMILGNCLCYSLFLVLQRPVLSRIPWRTVIAASFFFGTLGVIPFALPALLAMHPSAVPASAWWGVAYIILFPTVFAYAAATWAVRRSSPALVAAYSTLQPLVAAALAASFLGERFGWIEGIGFALIVAGLWQVSRQPSRR